MTEQEQLLQTGRLVQRAWQEPSFRALLEVNPRAALMEYGLPVPPEGVELKVLFDDYELSTFVIPPKPKLGG